MGNNIAIMLYGDKQLLDLPRWSFHIYAMPNHYILYSETNMILFIIYIIIKKQYALREYLLLSCGMYALLLELFNRACKQLSWLGFSNTFGNILGFSFQRCQNITHLFPKTPRIKLQGKSCMYSCMAIHILPVSLDQIDK